MSQQWLFDCEEIAPRIEPFKSQLLKWIGNKQRFAHEIASYFPEGFGTYHEPFLGSGAVLATLAPKKAFASNVFPPLMKIWQTLRKSPATLKRWYAERRASSTRGANKKDTRRSRLPTTRSPAGQTWSFSAGLVMAVLCAFARQTATCRRPAVFTILFHPRVSPKGQTTGTGERWERPLI